MSGAPADPPDAAPAPAEVVPTVIPPASGPVSGSFDDVDEERALLAGIVPGTEGDALAVDAAKLMRVKNATGRFAASRMFEKPSKRESEVLHHRAKCALVDAAALTVPMFFSELAEDSPNKVRLDGCLAVMRGTGLMVDGVPISGGQREKDMAETRKLAERSTSEIKAGLQDKLQRMRLQAGAEKK